MNKELRKNIVLYLIRSLTNLIFEVIVFSYVAKKLEPDNIGEIQYIESIVAYFIIFISLGVPDYGKREVAYNQNDKNKLKQIVVEMWIIMFITTIIGSIVYVIFFLFILKSYRKLMFIFFINIVFNFFNFEWFFIGIENQKYITQRNMIIKILGSIFIFYFIKSQKDKYIYCIIMMLILLSTNLINFFKCYKYLEINKFKIEIKQIKQIKKHIKPIFVLFFSSLAFSISYNLDLIMIKIFSNTTQLGYYSFALRFGRVPLVLIAAISSVYFPRLCKYIQEEKWQIYLKTLEELLNFILILILPISIIFFFSTDILLKIFGGDAYLNAISIAKVFAIYIVIASFSTFTGTLTLIVNRREKVFMFSLIVGGILNFICNLLLISRIGAIGAAIATVVTEFVSIIVRIGFAKDLFRQIKFLDNNKIKICFSSTILLLFIYIYKVFMINSVVNFLVIIVISILSYMISLILLKENTVISIITNIIKLFNLKESKNE